GIGYLAHRLRRVADAGGASSHAAQPRRVVGMVDLVQRKPPFALAAEALHPPRRIRREADPRLLAVIAHVDPALELFPHDVPHGSLGLAREGGKVDSFAVVLSNEQVAERGGTGKAADVRGQDPLLAAFHGSSVRVAI